MQDCLTPQSTRLWLVIQIEQFVRDRYRIIRFVSSQPLCRSTATLGKLKSVQARNDIFQMVVPRDDKAAKKHNFKGLNVAEYCKGGRDDHTSTLFD